MIRKRLLQPGRRVLWMFLSITLLLVWALAWMSWLWMVQDRALGAQRMQERRETASDLAVAALQRQLAQAEEQLTALSVGGRAELWESKLPDDAALLVFRSGTLEVFARRPLLFRPDAESTGTISTGLFVVADQMEFRDRDYARAAALLRKLALHSDPPVRAEALMRLARVSAKSGATAEALAVYAQLARLDAVPVASLPAALLAHEARMLLFQKEDNAAAARLEAGILCDALQAGTWKISRTAYEFYTQESCGKTGTQPDAAANALASAVETMWEELAEIRRGAATPQGRQTTWQNERPMLMLWRSSEHGAAALVCGATGMRALLSAPVEAILEARATRIALTDHEGHAVLGTPPAASVPQSVRLAAATQLPWTVHVISTAEGIAPDDRARQRLIFIAACTMLLLVLAASYFIARAAAREMAVARLQSDFVASVSHEFRTPITALRQLSELLISGRVANEEDRNEYYVALGRESERMHRLVEGLLNFGRLESGAMQYRFELLEVVEFVVSIIAEFRRDVGGRGYHVEFTTNGCRPKVHGDRAALGCVITNLLDNAVKYSTACTTVWVEVGRDPREGVAIRVRDRGMGVPRDEQERIFQKFVRGAAAKEHSIRGAGVGLAMARQIVTAHRGEIRLGSSPGKGSTFTVLLPEVN